MRLLLIVIALFLMTVEGVAGPERINLPENYQKTFVRYMAVDKPAGDKPAKIRFMYVSPHALVEVKSGQPLPNDTILIMEDRSVVLNADGQAVLDKQGGLIPTDEVTGIIIQQKKSGWGDDYSEEIHNGDWDYAVFNADGTRKQDVEYEKCFACHKGQAKDDYNFTFSSFVSRIK